MNRALKALRGVVAAGAVAALVQGIGAVAFSPSAEANSGSMIVTTAVNVRPGPNTNQSRIGVLYPGAQVTAVGSSNGWTEVNYNGRTAYVSSQYLRSTGGGSSGDGGSSSGSATSARTTAGALNLRSGPGTNHPVGAVVSRGTTLSLTGTTQNGFAQVTRNGQTLWASQQYLSTSSSSSSSGGSGGSSSSGVGASLNRGYSSGLDQTNANVQKIVRHVWETRSQIKTMYGWRRDVTPDHPAGRAVDIMIPNWNTAAGKALGWEIANYYRANAAEFRVHYIIFDQQIWNLSRDREGWRPMDDRGNNTANHKDHVHITTYDD